MGKIVTGDMVGTSGKVGNKVYYTSNGKTIVRQTSAAKYNSKTVQQLLQRIIVKTCASNYSALKDIVNHSFQGVKVGADSMAKFNSLNANYLRDRAAEVVNSGNSIDAFIQFSKLGQTKFVPAALYVSTGTLVQMHPSITPFTTQGSAIACLACPANTYAGLANQYNLKRGDQVTFLTVEKDQFGEYIVKYERIILDPRQGGDVAPMSTALIENSAIKNPSRRNEGSFFYLAYDDNAKQIRWKGIDGDVAAVAVIVSRRVGSEWFRNNAKLVLNEDVIGDDKVSLGAALADAQRGTTEIYLGEDSEYYLNNAGQGGSEGTSDPAESETPVSSETSFDNTVKLNNVSQNISGGSVGITMSQGQSLTVEITGQNIDAATGEIVDDPIVRGQADATVQRTYDSSRTKLTFVISNITIPANIDFNLDGEQWFTVNASLPSSGGSGFDSGE